MVHQNAVTLRTAATYPAPQLIKLRQAEPVSPVNNQRINIRHIQSRLNNSGAYQDIALAAAEVCHHLLKPDFGHLPVGNGYPGFGY